LIVPDLGQVAVGGMNGRSLLMVGLVVCVLGLLFGIVIFKQLRGLPVHPAMREISELIYETCKTYLITQGKFLLLLEAFIGVIIVLYFGVLLKFDASKVLIILAFSLIGIGGSYGVAWFGMRINTFANSRTAFASLAGKPFPVYAIPLKAGMSADCTGDNAGASVGPSADGFETYGVTGVALISFILLAVKEPAVQVQLLVWIFTMRVLMIVASGVSYLLNEGMARAKYGSAT